MSVFFELQDQTIVISGRTFLHKDHIKSLGSAKFNYNDKTWQLPHSPETLQNVAKLCQSLGGGPLTGGIGNTKVTLSAPQVQPVSGVSSLPPKAELGQGAEAVDVAAITTAPDGYTVSEIIDQTQLAIRGLFPRSVWVIGEIQNLNHRRGATFLALAEAKESGSATSTVTLNATLWQSAMTAIQSKHGETSLKDVLGEGLRGRFLCQVNLYRDRGYLSLNIQDIDPQFTKGALALQRERLMKELRQKGLDQLNKQQRLGHFPLCVGLISADDSRAKSDFLHQLWSYQFPGKVLFYKTSMQGEQVRTGVCQGIKALEAHCDVIVITRGGGSAADLRWFDDRELALAVANAQRPIIAAIGHHDDICVVEEVAFRREKTPTAAADFLVHRLQQTKEQLARHGQLMTEKVQHQIQFCDKETRNLKEQLQRNTTQKLVDQNQRLWEHTQAITKHIYRRSQEQQERLQNYRYQLNNKSQDQIFRAAKRLDKSGNDLAQQALRNLDSKVQVTRNHAYSLRESSHSTVREGLFALQAKRQALAYGVQETCQHHAMTLQKLTGHIQAIDPIPWLTKGWTQLWRHQQPVRHLQDVSPGDQVVARLRDGKLVLAVTEMQPTPSTPERTIP